MPVAEDVDVGHAVAVREYVEAGAGDPELVVHHDQLPHLPHNHRLGLKNELLSFSLLLILLSFKVEKFEADRNFPSSNKLMRIIVRREPRARVANI